MLLRADRRRNPQKGSSLNIASGRYRIDTDKKLGAGCFGEVWRGVEVSTQEAVAVKFEDLGSQPLQLEHEASILRQLAAAEHPQGFVRCFHSGQEGRFNCMVVDLLGRSLEDHVGMCQDKKFTAPTAVLLAEQILCRIEYLHAKGIVHQDIKPDNFMSGVGPKVHHIYIIDFGLAKRYYADGQHIKYRNQVSFAGTVRYASINAHKGIQQTRRDDLEAIGHMLLYLLRGSLPWSGMSGKTEEKYRKIRAKKETMPLDELCAGFPDEFKTYLRDVRKLGFRERPNYAGLRQLFSTLRSSLELQDHDFEWLQGRRLGTLEPLLPQANLTQPDDASARDRLAGGSGGAEAAESRPPRRGLMARLICGGSERAEA